ncbi:hypothetical protein ACLMJK_003235 [Lecanora helva]
MTVRGKQVKTQTLFSEREIFLYDRRILTSSSSSDLSIVPPRKEFPKPFLPDPAPDNAPNENTLGAWQTLFKRRRVWTQALTDGAQTIVESVAKINAEISIVQRGARIAVDNVQQHFANLQVKYTESTAWAEQVRGDQEFLLQNWRNTLQKLGSLQVKVTLGQCLRGVSGFVRHRNVRTDRDGQCSLGELLDQDEVERAADSVQELSQRFSDRVEDLNTTFDQVLLESSNIVSDFHDDEQFSQNDLGDLADRLKEEIEVVARKINADYEHVLGVPNSQKSISQVAKMAQSHKSNLLPSLNQINDELNQFLIQAIERKTQVIQSSIRYLQEISVIESKIPDVHSKLASLDINDEHGQVFDTLHLVINFPAIYGSLLVECVKRQEWAEKMTTDSSSLVEEIATYKEEEAKRRKKWIKELDGAIDLGHLDDMALVIEVNVHSQKQKWPKLSRDDIHGFMESLGGLGGFDEALHNIEEDFKTLDTPSKHQSRRARAFKNGSVHEATFTRSILLREDDDVVIAMKNEKSRIEEKLKSAESRVRKLEDLLHRQSQVSSFSRPSSATGLPPSNGTLFERHASSPVTNLSSVPSKARESGTQRPSVSSRRASMNNDTEEKALTQRVVNLEAEIMNEKAYSADLIKKVTAQTDAEDILKSQIREAMSTKEDLLGNFEALQREFDDERRLLHEENNKVKFQLEQLEDEFDRVLDTREHDEKIRLLEEKLEQVQVTAANDIAVARHQTESLRADLAGQQEQRQMIESELKKQTDDKAELTQNAERLSLRLQAHDKARVDQHRVLRTAFLHLSQDGSAPEDFEFMVDAFESVSAKAATHLKDVQNTLETLRADNGALEARMSGQDDEIYDLRERLGSEERKVFTLQEDLDMNQTQTASLQTQLKSERQEHDQLKTRFASGETGLNALRAQLTDKETHAAALLGQVTEHEVSIKKLNEQVQQLEADLQLAHQDNVKISNAREACTSRSVDVSTRLLAQNAVLERLLEHIGLIVSREEGRMIVQKAPKGTSASAMLNDPSAPMKRSLSGPILMGSDAVPLIESESLRWAEAGNIQGLQRLFATFESKVTEFDTDTFNQAVCKRFKEIEHIARKWQKEARAYREKAHRAQSEAHDRIALRNFKEGDLALFLPTRDQATKPWAAFNVGAPHCFLREQDSHNLAKRDWLIARISRVDERIVDLSKSINSGLKGSSEQKIGGDKSNANSLYTDENPYELSDGLRWYLIDAAEEKPGAPISVGTGKVTVASANVDAKGSIRMKKTSDGNAATKTLTRSLDSRRSSTNSKKGLVAVTSNSPASNNTGFDGMVEQSIDNAAAAAAASSNLQVTKDTQRLQEEERPRSSQTLDIPAGGGLPADNVGNFSTFRDS